MRDSPGYSPALRLCSCVLFVEHVSLYINVNSNGFVDLLTFCVWCHVHGKVMQLWNNVEKEHEAL